MYTVGNITYSKDSKTNIEIAKAFVAREVKMNMTEFVDYVFDTAKKDNAPPIETEDIEYGTAKTQCPYCGGEMKDEPIFVSELHLTPELNDDPCCDIEETYLCPVCGAGYASYMAAAFCCESLEVYICDECQKVIPAEEYDDLLGGDMPNEWWAVSPWLFEKLKAKGAPFIEKYNLWGREEISSVTPLEKDDMILTICQELEILDGQKNSWSKYLKLA